VGVKKKTKRETLKKVSLLIDKGGYFTLRRDIGKQANAEWEDMLNSLKHGKVKVIPPPPGYIPPKRSKKQPYNRRRQSPKPFDIL